MTLLAINSAVFVLTTRWINPLCFALSPVALAIVFFYSLTKRFTSFSHFFLGLALSVSPVGAWLAVRGEFALPPLVLALAVLIAAFFVLTSHYVAAAFFLTLAVLTLAGWHAQEPEEA